MRYYHGLIDTQLLNTGVSYDCFPEVVIIVILPYDPFGQNRMVYTIKNQCVEDPKVEYGDGALKMLLYPKGTEGNPSKSLRDMLKYMENMKGGEILERLKLRNRRLAIILIGVLGLAILIAVGYFAIYQIGKQRIREDIISQLNVIPGGTEEQSYEALVYQDEEYVYRDDLINILCLGIDKEEPMSVRNNADSSMGQADAIFLMSMDLDNRKIRLIAVPRDTMVMVQKYTSDGTYAGEGEGQIALQYAYGDGREMSATLMAEQVSQMLGNIPIHAYLAINVHSLWDLNEAIGGVDVYMDADYTMFNPAFVEGETVHLIGNLFENFIRERDKRDPDGAYTRMHRMKLYMIAFFEKARDILKEDMTLPIRFLNARKDDLETSVSVDETIYIVTEAIECSFLSEDMYTLQGDNLLVDGYMEYRLDETAVQELVIDLFYSRK